MSGGVVGRYKLKPAGASAASGHLAKLPQRGWAFSHPGQSFQLLVIGRVWTHLEG